jgi:hypothetical protein
MRFAAGLASAVLVAGCGILPTPDGAPDWVANRKPLDACGTELLDQGEPHDETVRRCLLEAHEAGLGAEMISTRPTIEGDLITTFTRVHENGVVELFIDATRDRFGSGVWERVVCDALVPVEEVNDPPDIVLPADMVFTEAGCEEQPIP